MRPVPLLLAPAVALVFLAGCGPWISLKEDALQQDGDGDGLAWSEDCDDDDADVGDAVVWHTDADRDGYGDPDATASSCGQPPGLVADGSDCDDTNSAVHPGADEVWYDGEDQDCDEATEYDADGDGYDAEQGGGDDCDDGDPGVHPGAVDGLFDDVDQDCDGETGTDGDGDGYANMAYGGDDCDDDDADVYPGADEVWYDGVDQDCAGGDDWDADGDGYSTDAVGGADCDDGDADVSPGAEEVCDDGVDNDCDGATDDVDADGDGVDDVLVSASYDDTEASNAGAVYLVLGPVRGTDSLADADAVLTGADADDQAGKSMAGGSDLDGDGALDVVVGAWGQDIGGLNAGAVYLVLGPVSADLSLERADSHLVGDAAGDSAGRAVACVGDTDDDGYGEVAIGAYLQDGAATNAGVVYLVGGDVAGDFLLEALDRTITGDAANDYLGEAVAGPGDIDGDGLTDVLVGARRSDFAGTDAGAAGLVFGPINDPVTLSDADALLIGEVAGDGAGLAVAGAGDTDGDGYLDLLVGAPYQDTAAANAGAAYLVRGPVLGALGLYNADVALYGEVSGDQAGTTVSGAGDVDDDGVADVLVGAADGGAAGTASGTAYLALGGGVLAGLDGTLDLADVDAAIEGIAAGDAAGSSRAGPGDVDGDGVDDLLVGAQRVDGYAGAAYLLSGGGL